MNWFVGEKEGVGGVSVFSCRKPDRAFCCASKSSAPDCGAFDAFESILGAGFGGGGGGVIDGLGGFWSAHGADIGGVGTVVDGCAVVFGEIEGFCSTLGADVGGVGNACGALGAL